MPVVYFLHPMQLIIKFGVLLRGVTIDLLVSHFSLLHLLQKRLIYLLEKVRFHNFANNI